MSNTEILSLPSNSTNEKPYLLLFENMAEFLKSIQRR